MFDYESPITQIVGEMQTEYENHVLKAVKNIGIHVNREELVKALAYDRGQYEKGFEDGAESVRALAPYEGGWIPCSERLPEDKREVLVWDGFQEMHCVAWYNPPTKIWYSNDFDFEDSKHIVAWMELPAPYQKGE